MTVALPLAWTGIVLGFVAFTYTLCRDIFDGRRLDALDDEHDRHVRDDHGSLVERVHRLEAALAAAHARIDSLAVPEPAEMAQEAAVRPVEPRTSPIRLPVPPSRTTTVQGRTDTREAGAVIDQQHADLIHREFGGRKFSFRATP